MRRKVRQKRFWILLTICGFIVLILLRKVFEKLQDLQSVEHFDRSDYFFSTSSRIERVRVSDVIAVNDFISSTFPTTKFYAYNHRLSDKIGAYRALPDTRDEACKARNYFLPHHGLKVSVIIAFHNEARSTLMRTIMSLYRRTPAKYLHEIVLVDDFSDDALLLSTLRHLAVAPFAARNFFDANTNATARNLRGSSNSNSNKNKYDNHSDVDAEVDVDVDDFVVIKMQRNSRRLGLIESRNLGARLATGDYLLFLDSHCEFNVGWLEPLLERVVYGSRIGNVTVAVSPVLDSINSETLEYSATSQHLMGGFDWNLHFHWVRRTLRGNDARQINMKQNIVNAFSSPVTAGGVFLISRLGFNNVGGFNSLLQIWGGESIELSIKLWLCGGRIEIVPCSRVGHIFRKQHHFQFPYDDDGKMTYLRNSKIIAESWFDDHKHFFYALNPKAKKVSSNISFHKLERFKNSQQCRPFSWYLSNVYPELKPPNDDFIAFGTLSTAELCVHITQPHQMEPDQKSPISSSSSKASTTFNTPHVRLLMVNCYQTDVTRWYLHRQNGLLHSSSGACLSVVRTSSSSVASLALLPLTPFLNQTDSTINTTHFHVVLQYCRRKSKAKAQRWLRRGAQLIHEQTHLCLDNPLNDVVAVSHCRHEAPSQLFHFTMEMQQLRRLQ